jgi:hypothetical protein
MRDQTVAGVEDVMAQARTTGRQISAGVHKQAEDLQQRGQAMLDEQKERVATFGRSWEKGRPGFCQLTWQVCLAHEPGPRQIAVGMTNLLIAEKYANSSTPLPTPKLW